MLYAFIDWVKALIARCLKYAFQACMKAFMARSMFPCQHIAKQQKQIGKQEQFK